MRGIFGLFWELQDEDVFWMVCLIIVVICSGEVLAGEQFSLDELKAGMKVARESIENLSLEYYCERKFEDERLDWKSEEKFRTRLDGGMVYYEFGYGKTGDAEKDNGRSVLDRVVTFDGIETRVFLKPIEERGLVGSAEKGDLKLSHRGSPLLLGPHPHLYVWNWVAPVEDLWLASEVVVSEGEKMLGVDTVKVVRDNSLSTMTFWVAPSRSFLPLKYTIEPKGGVSILRRALGGLKQLENGIWYPMEVVQDGGEGSRIYERFVITGASSAAIPDSVFRFEFPEGTEVVGSYDELELVIERDAMIKMLMGQWGLGVVVLVLIVGGGIWIRKKGFV